MKRLLQAKKRLLARRARIRKKIRGSAARPRVNVSFTNRHIAAQVIDDDSGKTLASITSLGKASQVKGKNADSARVLGGALAEKMKQAGVGAAVFDRNGKLYHGKVKAFADAMREKGIVL
ncbi:MAG: 50S ribosomal protein L18 [Nitrospinota bacterium]|nr:50S ribosomal protein L18 [Nitrospinota bacterium]